MPQKTIKHVWYFNNWMQYWGKLQIILKRKNNNELYRVYWQKRHLHVHKCLPPQKKVHSFQLCTDDRRLMLWQATHANRQVVASLNEPKLKKWNSDGHGGGVTAEISSNNSVFQCFHVFNVCNLSHIYPYLFYMYFNYTFSPFVQYYPSSHVQSHVLLLYLLHIYFN